MRSRGPDKMLLLFTGLLLLYGLLVLYSAGQTDTPTNAAGAWTPAARLGGSRIRRGLSRLPDLAPHPRMDHTRGVSSARSACSRSPW
jgi:hypothetical protein